MQTNVVVAVQEVNLVVDGTVEGSNHPAHKISHQCNVIIVVNMGTMQDNVQRQLVVLQEEVLVIASTRGVISLRCEEETARVAGGPDFWDSMSSIMERDMNTR